MNRIGDFFGQIMQPRSCCGGSSNRLDRLIPLLDKVCRVALALFAISINSYLFTTSFIIGAAMALLYVAGTRGGDQNFGTLKPVCGQGYMEFLSGKVWPLWTVHIVTTAFVAAHVRHDPAFFVPFSGLFIGWWAASEVGSAAWQIGKRFN